MSATIYSARVQNIDRLARITQKAQLPHTGCLNWFHAGPHLLHGTAIPISIQNETTNFVETQLKEVGHTMSIYFDCVRLQASPYQSNCITPEIELTTPKAKRTQI